MSDWAPKRFWKETRVVALEDGFGIELDGRRVKTPGKSDFRTPTRALAEAAAVEWDAQEGLIRPQTMPVTRAVNSAIERVTPHRDEVVTMLAEYGDADLLCYRAEGPDALVARQRAVWDPPLDWAAEYLGARLLPRTGLMHAPQDAAALARLKAYVVGFDAFRLTGFHDLVVLSGSLILAAAAAEGWRPVSEIWEMSRLDETWQQEQWGTDPEAEEAADAKRTDFLAAKRFLDLS